MKHASGKQESIQLCSRQRKPKSILANASAEDQAQATKLRRIARSKDIDLWTMDEVHFQLVAMHCFDSVSVFV